MKFLFVTLLFLMFFDASYTAAQPVLQRQKISTEEDFDAAALADEEAEVTLEAEQGVEKKTVLHGDTKLKIKAPPESVRQPKEAVKTLPNESKKETLKVEIKSGENLDEIRNLSSQEKELISDLVEHGFLEKWDSIPSDEKLELTKNFITEHLHRRHSYGVSWDLKYNDITIEKFVIKDSVNVVGNYSDPSQNLHFFFLKKKEKLKNFSIRKKQNFLGNPTFEINGKIVELIVAKEEPLGTYRTKAIQGPAADDLKRFTLKNSKQKIEKLSDIKGCLKRAVRNALFAGTVVLSFVAVPLHQVAAEAYVNPTSQYKAETVQKTQELLDEIPVYNYAPEWATISADDLDKIGKFIAENQKNLKAGDFLKIDLLLRRFPETQVSSLRAEIYNKTLENFRTGLITSEDMAFHLLNLNPNAFLDLTENEQLQLFDSLQEMYKITEPVFGPKGGTWLTYNTNQKVLVPTVDLDDSSLNTSSHVREISLEEKYKIFRALIWKKLIRKSD